MHEDVEIRARAYRAAGMEPSWDIVWRQGVDVTHEPPSTWPWPYSMYAAGGRGPEMRRQMLALHAAARRRMMPDTVSE